jgi:hypothetical protein
LVGEEVVDGATAWLGIVEPGLMAAGDDLELGMRDQPRLLSGTFDGLVAVVALAPDEQDGLADPGELVVGEAIAP